MPNAYDKVLITGGAGMLAHALDRSLRARGVNALLMSRADADITNLSHLDKILRTDATLLLNCAAYTKVDLAEQEEDRADDVNAVAVGELANACKNGGKKLVHFSTDFVFDGRSRRPYRADDPTNPIGAYGRSKLEGERCALDHLKYG